MAAACCKTKLSWIKNIPPERNHQGFKRFQKWKAQGPTMELKRQFTQKSKFCHHLLTLKLFQTCSFFLVWRMWLSKQLLVPIPQYGKKGYWSQKRLSHQEVIETSYQCRELNFPLGQFSWLHHSTTSTTGEWMTEKCLDFRVGLSITVFHVCGEGIVNLVLTQLFWNGMHSANQCTFKLHGSSYYPGFVWSRSPKSRSYN